MPRQRIDNPSERQCAQRFLDWHNSQEGTTYAIVGRAECIFFDLRGKTRWEFVARQDESEEWIAIEVKRLPFLGLNRPWSDWRRLFCDLNDDLRCRLQGTILIHFPPTYSFNQQQRKQLLAALAEVIVQEVSHLGQDSEIRDVGPEIAKCFPHWPRTKSNTREYDRWGEFRPSELFISKESDQGCEVRLSGGVSTGGDLIQAHEAALGRVFDVKEGVTANRQLGLAKTKGATATILLLDSDPGYQETIVREFLREFPADLLADIDYAYVVGVGGVFRVYPS